MAHIVTYEFATEADALAWAGARGTSRVYDADDDHVGGWVATDFNSPTPAVLPTWIVDPLGGAPVGSIGVRISIEIPVGRTAVETASEDKDPILSRHRETQEAKTR